MEGELDVRLGSDPETRSDHHGHTPSRLKHRVVDCEFFLVSYAENRTVVVALGRGVQTACKDLPEWRNLRRWLPAKPDTAEDREVGIRGLVGPRIRTVGPIELANKAPPSRQRCA